MTKKQSLTQTTVNKLKKRYIAFDVETTGLYPNIHKIIEIGAVLFEEGEIIKTFGTLVDSGVPKTQLQNTLTLLIKKRIEL